MVDWLKEEPNSTEGGKKLGPEQGAVNGFSMGLTYCSDTEYGSQAAHEDQEGPEPQRAWPEYREPGVEEVVAKPAGGRWPR